MKTYRFKIEWYDNINNEDVEDHGWVCGECYSDAVENISKLYRISDKDKDKETLITSISLYQTDNSYSVVLDDDVLNTIMAEAKDGQSRKE